VYEDGRIVRDFVFIDDVIAALLAVVRSDGPSTLVADIGAGQPITLLDLAEMVAQETGAPPPRISGSYRLGDVRAAYADVTHAKAALGWSPEVDARTGVRRLLGWIESVRSGQEFR
jgi:dTDP-L-rhamnose 4-epimerase